MKKRKLLNPKGWDAYRHSLRYGEYFQHEQTEKERVKWVGYILPVPLTPFAKVFSPEGLLH